MNFLAYRKMLVLGFLFLGVSVRAMVVQLPEAEDLEAQINKFMTGDFAEETGLIGRLANTEKKIEDVVIAIDEAVRAYGKFQKNPMLQVHANSNKSKLIHAILRNCAGAKAELRRLGVR